jgi:Holliday junction DNA helicase RuvA
MIGWLRGEVVRCDPQGVVVLNVAEVGYELSVPARTLGHLVEGAPAEFHVHTRVREDAIVLYGFESWLERSTFELLLATPGVGPTTALGALSVMTPAQLADAIAAEDVARLATIPGIGRKTAARLVLELNGKLPSLAAAPVPGARRDVALDLTAALRQLGYSAAEVRDALRDVDLPEDEEAALRVALRQLGRR